MLGKPHQRHHIVILGGGFAGLAAALELEKMRPFSKHPYNVTVIDKNCYHLYHALLYEVATAKEMVKEEELEALQRGVCIRIKALDEIFLKHQIVVLQDEITGLSLHERQILLAHGAPLHFDELIVALGSVSNDFGIPGLAEHGIALKELPDALQMNLSLQTIFRRAHSGEKLRVMIGGGGISGVETAAELRHYIQRLARKEKLPAENIEVHIVEASPSILNGFDAWAQRVTLARLQSLGVQVHTGQPIVSVDERNIVLKDGTALSYDLFLWSGGIRAHPLIAQLGVSPVGKGQANVSSTLQLPEHENVFVVGDSAAVMDPNTRRSVPQVVPEAVAQGRTAAANTFRRINVQPLQPYQPRHSGFVFPVGGRWAVSTMGGWKVKGWFGWMIRKIADLDYFLSILTFRKAWTVFWTGGRIYLRND